jgi:hypothetical protein
MSRTVPASLITAWSGDTAEPYFAVEFLLDVKSGADVDGNPIQFGPLRFWSGYGDRTIEGETYIGAGQLIKIDGISEVADLAAQGLTVSLSGLPSSIVSAALQEPYQRRVCRVYFGDASVSDVINVFSGRLNKMTIEDTADTGTISVLVDSKLVEADKASNRRYTSESQKSRHANDTFFDYVSGLQDAEIVWGRKSA